MNDQRVGGRLEGVFGIGAGRRADITARNGVGVCPRAASRRLSRKRIRLFTPDFMRFYIDSFDRDLDSRSRRGGLCGHGDHINRARRLSDQGTFGLPRLVAVGKDQFRFCYCAYKHRGIGLVKNRGNRSRIVEEATNRPCRHQRLLGTGKGFAFLFDLDTRRNRVTRDKKENHGTNRQGVFTAGVGH